MKRHTILLIIGVFVLGACLFVMSSCEGPSYHESVMRDLQARERARVSIDSIERANREWLVQHNADHAAKVERIRTSQFN